MTPAPCALRRITAASALVALATLLPPGVAAAATPLDGAWAVDLTTDPAKPYLKPMSLALNADGTLSGAFYDSAIEAGRWTESQGRLCVSFRTTDGRGPYHTSACLLDGAVQGQTWAEHRRFLFLWRAARRTSAPSP